MEIGTICWFALPVSNLKKSSSFYAPLFDWQLEEKEDLLIIFNDKTPIGHIYECKQMTRCELGAVMYITVESVDKTIEKAKELGGSIAKGKTELPEDEGFYAHLKDFDGNIMGIWSKS